MGNGIRCMMHKRFLRWVKNGKLERLGQVSNQITKLENILTIWGLGL